MLKISKSKGALAPCPPLPTPMYRAMYCLSCFIAYFCVCFVLLRRWTRFKLSHGRNISQRNCRLSARRNWIWAQFDVVRISSTSPTIGSYLDGPKCKFRNTDPCGLNQVGMDSPNVDRRVKLNRRSCGSHSSQYTPENVWNATHQAKHIPRVQCPACETWSQVSSLSKLCHYIVHIVHFPEHYKQTFFCRRYHADAKTSSIHLTGKLSLYRNGCIQA